jgi:hypothetical protein
MHQSVKYAILHLIKTVQNVPGDFKEAGLHHLSQRIGDRRDLGGQSVELRLQFGHGYFDGRKVLVWVDDDYREMTPEAAVEAYFDERVPDEFGDTKEKKEPPCAACGGTGLVKQKVYDTDRVIEINCPDCSPDGVGGG